MTGEKSNTSTEAKPMVLQSVNVPVPPPAQIQWTGNMSENWKFFKQKFEIFRIASKVTIESDDYQVALLLSLVGDRALKIYNNFVFETDGDKYKLDKVMKKFDDYFMPEKNVTYERHKFFLREQKPDEKIDSYVTELRDLSSTCNFGDLTDSLIRDRVILGIKDLAIKDRL